MRDSTVLVVLGLAISGAMGGAAYLASHAAKRESTPEPKRLSAPEIDGEGVKQAIQGVWNVVGELHVKTDEGRFVALKDLARGAGEFLGELPGETDEPLTDDDVRPIVDAFDRWDATGRSNDPALAGAAEPGAPASWGRSARRVLCARRDADRIRRASERARLLDQERSLTTRREAAAASARAELDAELARLRASKDYLELAPELNDVRRANAAVYERWRGRLEASGLRVAELAR